MWALVSISLLQPNKWALGSEKIVILGQKTCRACWRMLQALSANDATTTGTSSSTESEVEAHSHSTTDAAVMNTSFGLSSISRPFKRLGKRKHKRLKLAARFCKLLIYWANQESTSVKICDKTIVSQKKVKKRLNIQTDFSKPLVRSYNQLTEVPKSNLSL